VAKQIPLRIRRTEDKEKKGSRGAWRTEFCRKYFSLLTKCEEKSLQTLVESLTAKGETITCRKGCTYCCYHYVTVSLAQGIVIVDYLYKRKDLLKRFLDNYEQWHEKAKSIADRLDHIRTQSLSSPVPVGQVIAETRPLSSRYFGASIACPFLADDQCTIYPVRPPSCSSHHAVSPPEWCAPSSEEQPEIRRSMPDDADVIKLVQLADTRLSLFELSLPTMVYRLLTEGSAAIMTDITQHDFQ